MELGREWKMLIPLCMIKIAVTLVCVCVCVYVCVCIFWGEGEGEAMERGPVFLVLFSSSKNSH